MESKFKMFINLADEETVRKLGEEIGIVHDDESFEVMVRFIRGLIAKRIEKGA